MHNNIQNKQQEVICSCSGTSRQKIKQLIDDKRASNIEEISRITGACSGCGGCDTEVMKLLAEQV